MIKKKQVVNIPVECGVVAPGWKDGQAKPGLSLFVEINKIWFIDKFICKGQKFKDELKFKCHANRTISKSYKKNMVWNLEPGNKKKK